MKPKRSTKRISLARDLDKPRWRVFIVATLLIALFAMVSVKALELQILDRERAFKIARKQHRGTSTLLPRRGKIFDRNGKELAVNIDVKSIYANPKKVTKPSETAKILSEKLNLSQKKILNRVSSDKSFVWIKRLADSGSVEELQNLDITGLGYIPEPKRVYPNGHLLGQVIGITDVDSIGIEGIEYRYDRLLTGKTRKITLKRDARGHKILNDPSEIQEIDQYKTSGHDIVLTIDSQIQYIVERQLKEGVEEVGGEKGMAIIMNPETGEVLAMASYPFLDPNNFSKFPEVNRRNLPIWYAHEPGSTMKVFLASSALDDKKVNPNSKFNCENGRRKIGSAVIRDIKPRGTLTVAEIVKYSSNIGASKIGELLGRDKYYKYLNKFGFGKTTGIGLPGESSGILAAPRKWGPIELATISFGQGISVTSLQLVTALSAIANGGYLMKPYVIEKIVGPDGNVIEQNSPEVVTRVISYDTSYQMKQIMQGVVENGTGKKAQIPGFSVAGKTGTAQIPNPKSGGYYSDRYIASFIGFAPVEDPEIVMVVVVEAPRKKTHGGSVAAPIFKQIAEKVLFHMGISPKKVLVGMTVMPDLSGMSVRDILKWSEEEGVKVKVKGSGFVTNQQPLPGDLIKEGMVCSIELKQKYDP
ncbi:MAG: penicillin-binding transpeptidase domain-containing protein [Candidatus Dadabacteria bacterium]|nr:penicillin-binding transpeptidase domain-containing protein [Candidatus Dadabacteria bacterium]